MISIEEKLREALGIHHVFVVYNASTTFCSDDPKASSKLCPSDRLHWGLAERGADFLEDILHEDVRVGVASGRAVWLTCHTYGIRSLRKPITKRITKLNVCPLTAYVGAGMHGRNGHQLHGTFGQCDAEGAAHELCQGCWYSPFHPILGMGLALSEADAKLPEMKGFLSDVSPLAMKWWTGEACPSVAVVGVGVLAGGHRLLHRNPCPPEIKPVAKKIDELCNLVSDVNMKWSTLPERLRKRRSCLVGDLCNRLFLISSLSELGIDAAIDPSLSGIIELEARIQAQIDEINARLITANNQHFRSSRLRHVLMVAGGKEKAAAIAHIIRHGGFADKITLCTDDRCANEMRALSRPLPV